MQNPLKKKLAGNQVTIGSWITLGHTAVAEVMAEAGFEWLTIDMEHSVITLDVAQQLMQVIEGHGVVPLVRVGENDPTLIKRVMDAGAYGVIVPMVNSAQDARRAVAAVRYPPSGTRGVGLARAQAYGMDFESYATTINEESVVIAQVEHIDAVNNLEEIISTDGIDGCIIGPYDLSASLGVPGMFADKRVTTAIERVETICHDNRFPLGMHVIQPDHRQLLDRMHQGYTFLAFSLDILYLGNTCRQELVRAREGGA